jgi:hypothetical protein
MSEYLKAARDAINLHGRSLIYKSVGSPSYNIETGTATTGETSYTVKGYRRHVKANQYNYPDLIGQDVVQFYVIPSDIGVKPKPQDVVTDAEGTYKVISYQEHEALGQTVLMKILCVKG